MIIAAVIVTYNRAVKLEKSIHAIFAAKVAPQHVVVVDNGPSQESRDVLAGLKRSYQGIEVIETEQNIGGAGGFNLGLKVAYGLGATHFWLMDDDAYSNDTTLSELTRAYDMLSAEEPVGFLCSRVNWRDGGICHMNQPETTWDWMRPFEQDHPIIKVFTCSFVSCFFSRDILEQVGLPIKEFFIWFDDVEFTTRISDLYPSYAVLNSVLTHDTETNQSAYFAEIDDSNLWKFCYGAANESWINFKQKSFFHWVLFWVRRNRDMHKGKVSNRNRFQVNKAMLRGALRRIKIETVK